MATRRMFSKKITETDTFLDMPMSSQCLYFHLNMSADDDGFIGNAKTIKRMIGASDDDLKLLLAKEFIIPFESGVVVIKDWKIHNYIRKDTYNKTIYSNEKDQLTEDVNGSYTVRLLEVDEPSPQVRLGKVREGKVREEDTLSGEAEPYVPYKEIIDYLNEKTDSSFKSTSEVTKKLIKARCNEGFVIEDFKQVIDNKVADWKKDKKMSKFLRPQTLFSNKFEAYLNEKPPKKGGPGGGSFGQFDY